MYSCAVCISIVPKPLCRQPIRSVAVWKRRYSADIEVHGGLVSGLERGNGRAEGLMNAADSWVGGSLSLWRGLRIGPVILIHAWYIIELLVTSFRAPDFLSIGSIWMMRGY
jgi:hypothetical protein